MKLKNNLYTITTVDSAGRSVGIELRPDSLIYKAHFPEQPVTPGVCIVQIAGELLTELHPVKVELKSVANAKFLALIDPSVTRELRYSFKKINFSEDGSEVKVSVEVTGNDTVFAKLSIGYVVK